MSTYKHGSASLSHENPNLQVSSIRWLGVKSIDIISSSISSSISSEQGTGYERNILRLTARDRAKAISMLTHGVCAEEGEECEWRREIQRMVMLNVKAEIQSLSEGGLEVWLKGKLEGS